MGLLDTKVTTPSSLPEKFTRVKNREQYRQNYDEIFRKKNNTSKEEKSDESK